MGDRIFHQSDLTGRCRRLFEGSGDLSSYLLPVSRIPWGVITALQSENPHDLSLDNRNGAAGKRAPSKCSSNVPSGRSRLFISASADENASGKISVLLPFAAGLKQASFRLTGKRDPFISSNVARSLLMFTILTAYHVLHHEPIPRFA